VVISLSVAVASVLVAGCGRDAAEAENHAQAPDSAAQMAGMDMGDTSPGDTAQAGVLVSAEERARLGILITIAESRALEREVRLVGRVIPAETAARTVTTKVDGFVERLYVDFTGRAVWRGEPLFDLYSPMLVAAQQELLLALNLRRSLGADAVGEAVRNADSLIAASRRRLEYWDIDAEQIAELERTAAVRRTLTLRAPVTGVVLQKNVVQGQAIMAGAPLLQIADLSTVWLEADVFENDLAAVRTGQRAEVTFDAYPGDVVRGRVTYVYPTVDPVARTGRVRIELANAGDRVRPGLFGTARIRAPLGTRGVVIPRQAALVTGDRQLVFVELAGGRLVPRLVTLGIETDSLVEVRSGLRAGERVVAAAAFLLDAESNLGAAMAAMAGMDMGTGGTRRTDGPTDRRTDGPRLPAPKRDSMPDMNMPEHER
jgi:Cu(I)/Ag(I) efflux system membrane fusion protein